MAKTRVTVLASKRGWIHCVLLYFNNKCKNIYKSKRSDIRRSRPPRKPKTTSNWSRREQGLQRRCNHLTKRRSTEDLRVVLRSRSHRRCLYLDHNQRGLREFSRLCLGPNCEVIWTLQRSWHRQIREKLGGG